MTSRSQMLDKLGAVALFEGLSKKDLRMLLDASKEVSCPAGKVIVEEGKSGVGLHVILEGTAKVTKGGKKRATLREGGYFGEISMIDGGPRTATVVAETPVRLLSITSWAFSPILEHSPAIARKLLVEVCKRLRENERADTH